MVVLLVILISLTLLYLFINFVNYMTQRSRRAKIKYWKIGDKIRMVKSWEYNNELKKRNLAFVTLLGWTLDDLFVNIDNMTYQTKWSDMDYNKSATWRKYYMDAENCMGIQPKFNSTVIDEPETKPESETDSVVDGKPIELLTETECQVYLKMALEKEQFEIAEAIKKRMEQFR